MRDSDIYLITVLSSLCGIIIDRAINAPGHGKNVVDGFNATEIFYLKGEMELIGKLESNNTTNIWMLPSASKTFPLNLQINVYKLSVIKRYWMHSNIEQNEKRENNNSNINNVYKMFKRTLILIT